ncbi:MAG: hypothetical protein ABIJ10_04065 [Candidatus Micrarchaeota archaeon]|nr:hypothetical protein [Candidatus Micrarchaeota archaeon]
MKNNLTGHKLFVPVLFIISILILLVFGYYLLSHSSQPPVGDIKIMAKQPVTDRNFADIKHEIGKRAVLSGVSEAEINLVNQNEINIKASSYDEKTIELFCDMISNLGILEIDMGNNTKFYGHDINSSTIQDIPAGLLNDSLVYGTMFSLKSGSDYVWDQIHSGGNEMKILFNQEEIEEDLVVDVFYFVNHDPLTLAITSNTEEDARKFQGLIKNGVLPVEISLTSCNIE